MDKDVTNVSEPVEDPTRDRLLAAAAEVFAEKGYDRAGVQEIARRAGFTTGAIYGRFRGKADLLLAAIASQSHDEFEELFAEYQIKGRALDILHTVGAHLVTDEFDSGQALLLEAFVAARREPELATMLREVITEQGSELGLLIEEAKRTGALDPELDSFSVVRFCHALGLGFLLFGALGLDRPDAAPWEALIARLIAAVGNPALAGENADAAAAPTAADGAAAAAADS
ncbi:MAG TPA: helix-turn-helix domain-containing protein [Acidimicrobiales bacterium]|nr:helix-turn-helix domain-containing protein [Acidimicrobiales bacterium]